MANGILNIWGTQYGIPPGNYKDILSIPYSTAIEVISLAIVGQTVGGTSVPVPTGVQGVILIPTYTGSVPTMRYGFVGTFADMLYMSPVYPTIWTFDPANLPSSIFYAISTGATGYITARFF